MMTMLEALLTFIGAILLLSLVSQSLLEAVKTALPIHAMTRMASARALIEEAARSQHLTTADGQAIYRAVAERLRGLGQSGWVGVRLDRLGPKDLAGLIQSIRPDAVPGLKNCENGGTRLEEVATQASTWFAIAMDPVAERYSRRMRVANIVAAVVVVFSLNVDAIALLERARTDPEFSSGVMARLQTVDSLLVRTEALRSTVNDSLAAEGAGTPMTTESVEAARAQLDTASARLQAVAAGSIGLFDVGAPRRYRDADWWLGILLSVFLVSLGAPFWHDLLGSLLGLKQRIQAEASQATPKKPGGGAGASGGAG